MIRFTGKRDNPFSHCGRWDSVGIDCDFCIYLESSDKWPNTEKNYSCKLHNISLKIQIQNNGFKQGEWFCSDFRNKLKDRSRSDDEFDKEVFEPRKLFCIGWPDEPLKTIGFDELEK